MSDQQTMTRKEFPNGDVALDKGDGLVYRTADAAYHVELDLPARPLSDEPYGVDLVRTTYDAEGQEHQQRLTLAEYHSQMAAEEHVREVEQTLRDQGRAGLDAEMNLVSAMPFEADEPLYLVGLYPPDPDADSAVLNVLRFDGERLDIAPVARGPVAEMAAIEQRLFEVQAEGDIDMFLTAATAEAVRAQTLAPNTPLFFVEGVDMVADRSLVLDSDPTLAGWEDHPDWPDATSWDQPPTPRSAALVLPVTFGDDMTPFDAQGRYVPHHHDEANTVHFFSVMDRPSDSPLPEDSAHELRYFRAQKDADDMVIHDSQPVMPVSDPTASPWPLPALELFMEDGDLDAAQALARQTAREHDLSFPDALPALGPERQQESGWYHYDTALVLATPMGVDDGYSVGAVDIYRNHQSEAWAARYLPMGEFDTFDDALGGELMVMRMRSEERLALSPAQFRDEPAIYERIARAEADAALTDLLEQHDGHLPPDYDGDHEPQWEPLSTKEWEAYRDFVQMIRDADPEIAPAYGTLPTATPHFAGEELVAGSEQPPLPYRTPEDFAPEVIALPTDLAPTWRLDIVPARDPEGAALGYSAVCVVDFSDLAETLSPEAPERGQWLEVAQFQTEERANQFREDFMSLADMDELSDITGPGFAEAVAGDLGMSGGWQVMDKESMEKLKAGEWVVEHPAEQWQPRMNEASSPAVEAAYLDLDL
ncbi:MAG: hypothetical protein OZ934_00630 [Anaerolineae bacterium]|nr:hypothetical protein [Anaerolineae bacterium]